jgi:catechol 2,3-dioxygenase-like lactoylglutathione lyase family enzyme
MIMIKDLWNIGVKTTDLTTEVDFLQKLGGELLLRESLNVGEEKFEYAILQLGGVRILLFPKVIFEDKIEGGVRPGLTHAVYEVDDLEAEYQRIKALGAKVLIEPREVSAGFGRRKLAFFLSPGGLVFEVMQILEAKI